MKNYIILNNPITIEGTLYQVGDIASFDEAVAAPFAEAGAIKETEANVAGSSQDSGDAEPELVSYKVIAEAGISITNVHGEQVSAQKDEVLQLDPKDEQTVTFLENGDISAEVEAAPEV